MSLIKGNKYQLKKIVLTDDTTVIATATNNQVLQPIEGRIYEVVWMRISIPIPAGGAAGNHYLKILNFEANDNQTLIAKLKANFGATITAGYGGSFFADSEEIPGGTGEQFALMTGGLIRASNSLPVWFYYGNDTDVSQTGTRTIELLVKEFTEGA